ncbi:MAG: ATP-binding protein [Chloroflexota bacterium]
MIVCEQCGEANPERFRLCGMCGAPLGVQLDAREVRKTVTIVFSDLKGSTSLGEQLDTESLREALTVYFDAMKAVLQRHGGTVEKYIGDAIMAVFGLPIVHEDDALRAVRAAGEMQQRLVEVNDELERRWGIRLENRTGVNTGEVVAGDPASGQRLVTGDTVNTAARLEQAAPASEVLIGPITQQLVRHAVQVEPVEPLELKGKAERVPAYRLVSVASGPSSARRLQAPLVGRSAELARLLDTQAASEQDRAGRLVTVVGAAGVGKSRLIEEFLASLGPTTVALRGRCLSYGDGITFWPLVAAIRAAAAIEDDLPPEPALQRLATLCSDRADVADRLAPLLGLSDVTYPIEETFWAVRMLLETLARAGSVVLVLDDIHWAEPTLLDLVEHVVTTAEAPIMVVCSARGDLIDERPGWGKVSAAGWISLEPLSESETEAVVGNIIGSVGLPEGLMGRITTAAEGNPLFVEQMLSMLVDGGVVRRGDDGTWMVADVADFPVPPSIAALIEARLDRLGLEDRTVLQEGSVVGLVFYEGAVESMSPDALKSVVDPSIRRLVRRQFVRPDPAVFMDEASYRFDHSLIHDAAYRSLLKRERADLHERFADWLEKVSGGRIGEMEEIIGYHLEQSAQHLGELGPLDDRGRALAGRASSQLGDAGRRAYGRGDVPAAANLLKRAVALLPIGARMRTELQLDLAEAYADLGEFEDSERCATEALEAARADGDGLLATNASLVGLFLRYTLDPQNRTLQVIRDTEAAIPILEAAEDHEGLVRAWRLLGWVHGTACQYGAAERAVEQAVHHARLAGDRRGESRNLMSLALSALYGPMHVTHAIAVGRRIAAEVGDDRRAEGVVLCALAHLHALRGEFDEARTLYRRARETLHALGGSMMAATVSVDSGRVELLAGDPVRAEQELRGDYDVLAAAGERYTLSTVAAMLAEAVLRQGRVDAALELTTQSEELSADDDVESQNLWRRVRARILAGRGDLASARILVDQAYRLVEETDAPLLKANTMMDKAHVHGEAGELEEGVGVAQRALALFEAKGDDVDVASARASIDRLMAVARTGS